jgi:hypothetical protein
MKRNFNDNKQSPAGRGNNNNNNRNNNNNNNFNNEPNDPPSGRPTLSLGIRPREQKQIDAGLSSSSNNSSSTLGTGGQRGQSSNNNRNNQNNHYAPQNNNGPNSFGRGGGRGQTQPQLQLQKKGSYNDSREEEMVLTQNPSSTQNSSSKGTIKLEIKIADIGKPSMDWFDMKNIGFDFNNIYQKEDFGGTTIHIPTIYFPGNGKEPCDYYISFPVSTTSGIYPIRDKTGEISSFTTWYDFLPTGIDHYKDQELIDSTVGFKTIAFLEAFEEHLLSIFENDLQLQRKYALIIKTNNVSLPDGKTSWKEWLKFQSAISHPTYSKNHPKEELRGTPNTLLSPNMSMKVWTGKQKYDPKSGLPITSSGFPMEDQDTIIYGNFKDFTKIVDRKDAADKNGIKAIKTYQEFQALLIYDKDIDMGKRFDLKSRVDALAPSLYCSGVMGKFMWKIKEMVVFEKNMKQQNGDNNPEKDAEDLKTFYEYQSSLALNLYKMVSSTDVDGNPVPVFNDQETSKEDVRNSAIDPNIASAEDNPGIQNGVETQLAEGGEFDLSKNTPRQDSVNETSGKGIGENEGDPDNEEYAMYLGLASSAVGGGKKRSINNPSDSGKESKKNKNHGYEGDMQ